MVRLIQALMLVLISGLMLVGCGSTDPLELVKTGTLEFDNSVTVGDAFDGYKYIKNPTWTTFQTDQGRTIVQMSAGVDPKDYSGTMIPGVWEIDDQTAAYLNKNGKFTYKVQFAVGKDGKTFSVHFVGIDAKFSALETKEIPDEKLETVQAAYNNQHSETMKAAFFVITSALVQKGVE